MSDPSDEYVPPPGEVVGDMSTFGLSQVESAIMVGKNEYAKSYMLVYIASAEDKTEDERTVAQAHLFGALLEHEEIDPGYSVIIIQQPSKEDIPYAMRYLLTRTDEPVLPETRDRYTAFLETLQECCEQDPGTKLMTVTTGIRRGGEGGQDDIETRIHKELQLSLLRDGLMNLGAILSRGPSLKIYSLRVEKDNPKDPAPPQDPIGTERLTEK
jgi:hypothetical protein|uniref:Uncharacterized protein n=1 Tax=viral metagenome TaxID=1070528 RepID=A0A6C0IUY8_9ZZZZ